DAANSHRRRSTQTTLHRLVAGLSKMLAPVLAFTADEAWEFVPGKTVESIHRTGWQPMEFALSAEEAEGWKVLFDTRALVLPELEKDRQSKMIGKSLDAKVELQGDTLVIQKRRIEELRELLNVSQLKVIEEPHSEAAAWRTEVKKADGEKCERCWHWETDVGS